MPNLDTFLSVVTAHEILRRPSLPASFTSVSTDSRSLRPGALFFALSGPNFDGGLFVQAAAQKGAAAAVVERILPQHRGLTIPIIGVRNVLDALTQWAMHWRSQWTGRVTAVCGSNGKTTVKQMVSAIFEEHYGPAFSWATPGNLNNHIGVPLSVLGLTAEHRMAVFELGMNHPNEIAALARIARPQVAVVTNAQREHQEFMKSVAAVAQENGEVFSALAAEGCAVFPRDAVHEPIWLAQVAGRSRIRFGFADAPAFSGYTGDEVLGRWSSGASGVDARLRVTCPDRSEFELTLQGVGAHFATNALAAVACAWANGIPVDSIVAALNRFAPVKGRGQRCRLSGGGLLIDDTYNANPDSVRAAIDALQRLPRPHGLVLGDMGEVGDQEAAFHQEVLRYAHAQAVDGLWLHGQAFASACQATGIGQSVSEVSDLIARVRHWSQQAQTQNLAPSVWVKGSRFMAMERVVSGLVANEGEVQACF